MTEIKRMRRDWHLWACAILALVIVLPRCLLITHAHSETVDEEYHIDHGLCVLWRQHNPLTYNDPPLGEIIIALPMHVAGVRIYQPSIADSNGIVAVQRNVFHGQRHSPVTLRLIVSAWKALLFIPCVLVAFVWVRQLYGVRSAWLSAALLLVEPTIAAHTPIAALDVLSMEMVIIASFLVWRYFASPTTTRLIFAGIATAAAMLTKHTAIVLPLAILILAVLHWFVRPWWQGRKISELRPQIRPRLNALAAGAMVTLVALWPLTLFDFRPPLEVGRVFGVEYREGFSILDDVLRPALEARWPAGIYFGSVLEAIEHGVMGHSCFLWGEIRDHGWWYYFPAIAMYKMPLGIWLILLLAVVSVFWVRPKWDEMFILVPILVCGIFVAASRINVGFRHFLPTLSLILLLASRCVATGSRPWIVVAAWLGIGLAAVHTLTFHPDYIAYLNAPWKHPWSAIADSNLDWGQSLKQVDRWLDEHPQHGRVVHYDGFDEPADPALSHYVKHKVRIVPKGGPPPADGLLIVSPTWLAGPYNRLQTYAHLRQVDPDDIIGHSLLVFGLDKLAARGILPKHKIQ